MQTLFLYLIAILMLLFTVTIHEIGHFIVGYLCNVNVKEISIGIGPKLAQKTTKSGIRISLKLIPLVAYVLFDSKQLRLLYENEVEDKNYNWYMAPLPEGKKFLDDTKTWQYILIMLAGVAMNLLAFFLLWPLCLLAYKLNGQSAVWQNPFITLGYSIKAIGYCMVFKAGSGNIFVEIPDIAKSQMWGLVFFNLLVMMNLITAIFNVIPFPPLDGWKVVTKIYESKTHKTIPEKIETTLSLIGIGLMCYIFIASILVRWVNW